MQKNIVEAMEGRLPLHKGSQRAISTC